MSRRNIFIGLAVIAIAAFTAVGIWGPDRSFDRRTSTEVVQVVDNQGQPVEGATTIIVERGGHGFPFGILLVPLGILFFFGVMRRAAFGSRFGGDPPCGPGGDRREEWMNNWHRRQHETIDPPTAAGGTVS